MKNMRIAQTLALPVTLVGLALAGCHKTELAILDHPQLAVGVRMQDVTFHSKALNRDMVYRVFLPAKIGAGKRLPVVYLLHGCGSGFRDWSNYSDVAKYAALGEGKAGLILVMPEGGCSYYVNAAEKPEDKYEDYLVNDVITDVEGRFAAATGRENRAIVGVSMGGFAAVKLALTRPELFAFAGAISPAIDVPSRHFNLRRWSQSARFRSIFGPDGSESRKNSDPFVLVKIADPAQTPYLYITAGEQEPLLEPNKRFAALLKQRGFAYEFHTKHGGHDWNEWDSQIPGCFESLLAHLGPAR